jgi:hypothetical protein
MISWTQCPVFCQFCRGRVALPKSEWGNQRGRTHGCAPTNDKIKVIDIARIGAGLKPAPADSADSITIQKWRLDIRANDTKVVMTVNEQFMRSYIFLAIQHYDK